MARECWIVVGTDFNQGADWALRQALAVAEVSEARVALVHAYDDSGGTHAERAETLCKLSAAMEQAILVSGAQERGVHVEAMLRRGDPAVKLLNVATDLGAGLIVVGPTGSRPASSGRPLGTVASYVLNLASRPVMVAHSRVDGGHGER